LPPAAASKKCIPNRRSRYSIVQATVSAGNANSIENEVVSVPQMKIGSRLIDIPGARSLNRVTMKLIAPTVVETVRKSSPSA
jgi:hypothetical protein